MMQTINGQAEYLRPFSHNPGAVITISEANKLKISCCQAESASLEGLGQIKCPRTSHLIDRVIEIRQREIRRLTRKQQKLARKNMVLKSLQVLRTIEHLKKLNAQRRGSTRYIPENKRKSYKLW